MSLLVLFGSTIFNLCAADRPPLHYRLITPHTYALSCPQFLTLLRPVLTPLLRPSSSTET